MSRAIVIDTSVFKKMAQKIQATIVMIKKAGLPPIMADYSMSRYGFNPISLDGPVPLSLTEGLAMCGAGMFPLPESFTSENRPLALEYAVTPKKSEKPMIPAMQKKSDNLEDANKHHDLVPVSAAEVNNVVSKEDNLLIADAIMASLKQNNMEARTEENLASNVTKITVEDILNQNRVRIPEYAVLRRG
jgi:hypothetical protein